MYNLYALKSKKPKNILSTSNQLLSRNRISSSQKNELPVRFQRQLRADRNLVFPLRSQELQIEKKNKFKLYFIISIIFNIILIIIITLLIILSKYKYKN